MSLRDWINPKYLEEKEVLNLNEKFKFAKNFCHLSIEDFFIKEKLLLVEKSLKLETYYKESSDLYEFLRTIDFKNSKNKVIVEFRKFLLSEEFIVFLEKITSLKFMRNKIDMHSLKLENTNYLLCHDDRVEMRKLAFVINFSDFEQRDGGALEFFKMNTNTFEGEVFESIIPKFSKFNIFEVCDKSYHQITEVVSKKERVTIGGWYHG